MTIVNVRIASPVPQDFAAFMSVVARSFERKLVDKLYFDNLCRKLGITAITDLVDKTELIPDAYNAMVDDGVVTAPNFAQLFNQRAPRHEN